LTPLESLGEKKKSEGNLGKKKKKKSSKTGGGRSIEKRLKGIPIDPERREGATDRRRGGGENKNAEPNGLKEPTEIFTRGTRGKKPGFSVPIGTKMQTGNVG